MPRLLLALAVLSATIFCVIDCIQSDEREIRNLPRFLWLIVIVIGPVLGPVGWLLIGRPKADRSAAGAQRPTLPQRPSAPDDDPTFLAGLSRTNDERRRLEAWERELEARERESGESAESDEEGHPRDKREQDGPGDEPATRT